jgi:hypothetical protein
MLTTSYFANIKNVASPLAICARSPSFYTGPELKILAPKYSIFVAYKNGEIGPEEYTVQYKKQVLRPLDPKEVWDRIVSIAGKDATLLCYEKPSDFCHRHIVADWLSSRLKIKVVELPELNYRKSMFD